MCKKFVEDKLAKRENPFFGQCLRAFYRGFDQEHWKQFELELEKDKTLFTKYIVRKKKSIHVGCPYMDDLDESFM